MRRTNGGAKRTKNVIHALITPYAIRDLRQSTTVDAQDDAKIPPERHLVVELLHEAPCRETTSRKIIINRQSPVQNALHKYKVLLCKDCTRFVCNVTWFVRNTCNMVYMYGSQGRSKLSTNTEHAYDCHRQCVAKCESVTSFWICNSDWNPMFVIQRVMSIAKIIFMLSTLCIISD